MINTPFAVYVGIVYGYLPLMVFPIYVSLEKLDKNLLEASNDLGGTPWRTFMQVTLPLSMPGVATGCMLVFILLMGEFLIPAFLGGGKIFFLGNIIGINIVFDFLGQFLIRHYLGGVMLSYIFFDKAVVDERSSILTY